MTLWLVLVGIFAFYGVCAFASDIVIWLRDRNL